MRLTTSLFAGALLIGPVLGAISCQAPEGGREQKLVIWESYTNDEHEVFLELTKLYREKYSKPGTPEVLVQRVPFDGLLSKIITAAIANQTPDICRVDVGHMGRLAYGGVAAPLDDFGVREHLKTLLPIAGESNTVTLVDPNTGKGETHVYGISDQLTCVALYYNKDMLAAAGIEQPPQTLEELVGAAKRLTNPEKGQFGLALNSSLWWHLPFLYVFGGDVMTPDNQKSRLADPSVVEAFRYLRALDTEGIEAGAWKAGAINPDQGFVNGKYAMVVSGPWNLKTFKSINYGVTLLPGRGDTKSATNVGGTSMIVLRNSKKQQAAYDFLRFLTSPAAQSVWMEKTGQLSVNLEVNRERQKALTPAMQAFAEQLLYARPRPTVPNYDQLENVVNPIFYSILDGKQDAQEGLELASRMVEEQIIAELK